MCARVCAFERIYARVKFMLGTVCGSKEGRGGSWQRGDGAGKRTCALSSRRRKGTPKKPIQYEASHAQVLSELQIPVHQGGAVQEELRTSGRVPPWPSLAGHQLLCKNASPAFGECEQ